MSDEDDLVTALHKSVSLLADDKCSFCESTTDLQYEYLIASTTCEDCRSLLFTWLRFNSGNLKYQFEKDLPHLRLSYSALLNLPEVKALRNKDETDK